MQRGAKPGRLGKRALRPELQLRLPQGTPLGVLPCVGDHNPTPRQIAGRPRQVDLAKQGGELLLGWWAAQAQLAAAGVGGGM